MPVNIDWVTLTCRASAALLTIVTAGTAVIAAAQFSSNTAVQSLLIAFAVVITALQIVFTAEAPEHKGLVAASLWIAAAILTAISVSATTKALETYYPKSDANNAGAMPGASYERNKDRYQALTNQLEASEMAEAEYQAINYKTDAKKERNRQAAITEEMSALSVLLEEAEKSAAGKETAEQKNLRLSGFVLAGILIDALRAVSLWLVNARKAKKSQSPGQKDAYQADKITTSIEASEAEAGKPKPAEEIKTESFGEFSKSFTMLRGMKEGDQVTIETFKSGLSCGYANAKPHYEEAKKRGWIIPVGRTFIISERVFT